MSVSPIPREHLSMQKKMLSVHGQQKYSVILLFNKHKNENVLTFHPLVLKRPRGGRHHIKEENIGKTGLQNPLCRITVFTLKFI